MTDGLGAYQGYMAEVASPLGIPAAAAASQQKKEEQYTILIAEDLSGLRNHGSAVLHRAFLGQLTIVQATNGQEAVELANTVNPDLVIMDIAMPVLNGLKAAHQIWACHPKTKILFWSQYYREIYIRDLARIVPDEAIHGYILKTGSDEDFLYAVKSLLLHDNPFFDQAVRTVKSRISQKTSCLSDVELETLNDLMLGMTDRAIATRRHISLRGVQSRIGSLYTKLLKGEDDRLKARSGGIEIVNQRARLIFEALKRGLIVPEELETLDSEFYSWIDESF